MSQEWYYSSDGERHGPVGAKKLKSLAASGDLRPDDLVWKEGMGEWQPASKLKKLFPEPADRSEPVTFQEAETTQPDRPSAAVGSRSAPPVEDGPAAAGRPGLWTPKWLTVASFFLTPAFGSYLVARNWTAMGEPEKARKSMRWFYGTLAWIAVCVLTTPFDLPIRLFWFVSCGVFVAWAVKGADPHRKAVEERYGDDYPRRSWGKPLLAAGGAVCGVMILSCAGMLMAGGDPRIAVVRSSSFDDYPQATIGELMDGFLADPEWSTSDDGNTVQVQGGMTYAGEPVEATVIFDVGPGGTFEMETLELNGIPQNRLIYNEFADLIVKQHRMGGG